VPESGKVHIHSAGEVYHSKEKEMVTRPRTCPGNKTTWTGFVGKHFPPTGTGELTVGNENCKSEIKDMPNLEVRGEIGRKQHG